MDQYLYIPFLGGWTSIYQLFWGSLGTRVLTHPHMILFLDGPSRCFLSRKDLKIWIFLRSVDSTHMLIIVYQYPQMAALLPMRSMTSDLRQRSFHKQIKNDKQSWWNCRTAHIQPLKWMAEGRENPWNAHFRKVLRLQVVVIHFSWKPW